jgi:uncharacterized protein YqjF (DUF2071 family)
VDSLRNVDHRPWPLPRGRWSMTQTWHDLLFAHWPVQPEAMARLIPAGLELDTFDGEAWVGIIAFRLSGIRLRWLPEIRLVSRFPEINVRTYVRAGGKPGVLFLSLDANNRLAIAMARPWFRLPYYLSQIEFDRKHEGIHFTSKRGVWGGCDATFDAHYCPCGPAFTAAAGGLESWLTERYCYYSPGSRGKAYRCDIHHEQWRLQHARAEIAANTMALSHGICLPECVPNLLYARRMKALVWPLVSVG